MKKPTLLFMALAASFALQAQWTDNAAQNTFIANCSDGAGEVYTSTDPVSGDTYVQWTSGASNGWAPFLQRLDFDGNPKWGDEGIHITTPNLASWSPGYAMTATNDGGVVSVFRTADAHHFAVRINADGSFPWGEHGLMLFDGQGGDRSEVMAGNDGGVWTLGTDYNYSYMQYVSSDGTLGPVITVGNEEMNHDFGLMVPGLDNSVLLVYEKNHWAYTYYYEKELWVVGFTVDGTQIAPESQLMAPYTMGGSYCHSVVPDGQFGGYAYMWHAGIMDAFNTYVFHFDENGNSTISDLNGVSVHSTDAANFYLGAYGTVDPVSHDLIIAYEQTDASTQSQSRIYMNRITSTGERLWGEGILVADNGPDPYSDILVDAFEDGSGFSVIYSKGNYNCTVEAKGFDMDGNLIWSTTMSSNSYSRAMCDNSTGFHLGQNVVAWVNSSNGGVYGQNIGLDGTMGKLAPIPSQCPGPENFQGEYIHDTNIDLYGVSLSWDPIDDPTYYVLYRTDAITGEETNIEIEGTATTYFDETGIGRFKYQLKGASEACGLTLPATTPEGDDYIYVEVTGLEEHEASQIVTLLKVFNAKGQCLNHNNVNELSNGIYILQGLTQDGQLISRKIVVNK